MWSTEKCEKANVLSLFTRLQRTSYSHKPSNRSNISNKIDVQVRLISALLNSLARENRFVRGTTDRCESIASQKKYAVCSSLATDHCQMCLNILMFVASGTQHLLFLFFVPNGLWFSTFFLSLSFSPFFCYQMVLVFSSFFSVSCFPDFFSIFFFLLIFFSCQLTLFFLFNFFSFRMILW